MVGSSELPTTPSALESKLKDILLVRFDFFMRIDTKLKLFVRLLKLATAWDAVLLIDEADVWSSLTGQLKANINLIIV